MRNRKIRIKIERERERQRDNRNEIIGEVGKRQATTNKYYSLNPLNVTTESIFIVHSLPLTQTSDTTISDPSLNPRLSLL